ncbi:hypothetical protein PFISCL1PPCAC_12628, partial [Pristionchus fissidentatus]
SFALSATSKMADIDAPPSIDDQLDVVQITPDHIRANGTLHTSPFAGIAELIDNAVDSNATSVKITTEIITDEETDAEDRIICVVDDGSGMDRKETLGVILVGHSVKKGDIGTIGQFGNGLKSGSMRIGETMLLVTKKEGEFTLLLISLKYLGDKQTHKCYAPCISLRCDMNGDLVRLDLPEESIEKHNHALSIMLKYSPFKNKEALFDKVANCFDGDSGTCVILSDLKREENGRYEMRYKDNVGDFIVAERGTHKTDVLSRYLQRLYLKPKISINIQGRTVRLVDPLRQLVDVRWDYLDPNGLKEFTNREIAQLDATMKRLNTDIGQKKNEENVKFKQRQSCENNFPPEKLKALDREIRMVQDQKTTLETKLAGISKRRDAIRSEKLGGDLRVHVGIELTNRHRPRVVFYTNGRRIVSRDLDTAAKKKMELLGVVCIIDIPSTFLPPSQSRENFETPGELGFLMTKINKIAKNYFLHAHPKYKTAEFWAAFGYTENGESPGDGTTTRAATIATGTSRMCLRCRKFREVAVDPSGNFPLPSLDSADDFFSCDRSIEGGQCGKLTNEETRRSNYKQVDKKGKMSSYDKKAKEDDKIVTKRSTSVAPKVQSPQRRTSGRRAALAASRSPSPALKKARRKRGINNDDDDYEENEMKPRRNHEFHNYDDVDENQDSDIGQASGPVSRRRIASSTNRRDTPAPSSSSIHSVTGSVGSARGTQQSQQLIKREAEQTLPLFSDTFRIPKKGDVKREEEDSDEDSDYCEKAAAEAAAAVKKKKKQSVKKTEQKDTHRKVEAVVRNPPLATTKRGRREEKKTKKTVAVERNKMTSTKSEPAVKKTRQVKVEDSSDDEDDGENNLASSDDSEDEDGDERRKKRHRLVPRSSTRSNGNGDKRRRGTVEDRRSRQSSMDMRDEQDDALIAFANGLGMQNDTNAAEMDEGNLSYETLVEMVQEERRANEEMRLEREGEAGALREWMSLGRKRRAENDNEQMTQLDEEMRAIEEADDPLNEVIEIMNRRNGGERQRGGSEVAPSTVHHEEEIEEEDGSLHRVE